MLRVILLVSAGVFFFCVKASAQKVNTDSLKLISTISNDQLKLGKLQNTVDKKTQSKHDDSVAAQQSADKNATAATRLSNDPQNKQDAKQADNAAGSAKSNARKARKANDQLLKVQQEIADLQSKISKEQGELNVYTRTPNVPVAPNAPIAPTVPVQSDTTQHQ
jgi:cell division protein FtsL